MNSEIVELEKNLREINRLKKKINFGEVSNFYHAVATSLGLAEGMYRYGFDNSLDVLLDKRNWNLKKLGGKQGKLGEVECENRPRISIYKLFTKNGFEVHCIPWIGDREFDVAMADHPQMDFKYWNPASMKVVFRISHLHSFIQHYFDHGDEADMMLIKCAHHTSEAFIKDISQKLNTQKVYGISVQGFFEFVETQRQKRAEIYLPKVYNFHY